MKSVMYEWKKFRITLEYCNKLPDLDGIYITGGGIAGVGSALEYYNGDNDGFKRIFGSGCKY